MEFNIDPKDLNLQDAAGMQLVEVIRNLADESGTSDYEDLDNLPKINGVTLVGNKSSDDLHIAVSDEKIAEAVDAWLGDNVDPETGYVLDDSLTLSNAAAPADKVGELKNATSAVNSIVTWRNGSCNNPSNAIGISFTDIEPSNYSTSVTILIDTPLTSGHKYRYQMTTYTVASGNPQNNAANRVTIERTIVTEENFLSYNLLDGSIGFAFALYELDENDDYVPLRVTTFDTSAIHVIKTHDSTRLPQNNYVVNSEFMKTPITITQIGWVNGTQSFCKYNDKYYSYGNSVLYEQNADFSRVGQTSLSIGHGNSLQLGSNGVAYSSGWDDQTIYVVDLATKELLDTITLPTTGYTTCAVDDVNGIVYIFQRDTAPSTEEHYNFIVYDYVNETIKSSKKTNKAFGGMQACDFVNGLIVVCNGLGTAQVPNGLRIYNTNGDVLSEFVIGEMSNVEPEGIFIDRSNYEILISYSNGNLYKLEKLNF